MEGKSLNHRKAGGRFIEVEMTEFDNSKADLSGFQKQLQQKTLNDCSFQPSFFQVSTIIKIGI